MERMATVFQVGMGARREVRDCFSLPLQGSPVAMGKLNCSPPDRNISPNLLSLSIAETHPATVTLILSLKVEFQRLLPLKLT